MHKIKENELKIQSVGLFLSLYTIKPCIVGICDIFYFFGYFGHTTQGPTVLEVRKQKLYNMICYCIYKTCAC